MNITIKQAKADDAAIISKIYAASWKSAYAGIVPQKYLDELKDDFWVQAFRNWLTNHTLQADILYTEGIPVGCIGYGKSRDEKLSNWGEIVSLYVDPNFYRQGYGEKLLFSALNTLKNEGYQACYLWVLADNLNAQHFYKAHGFIKTEDICHVELLGKQLTDLKYTRCL